ncbi:PspC domain-containing protein [Saccharomonospora sp. NPDC046836]|uniref:PspC domain-containing protein n=1 Tax=Saccharomonospora sp. NPDC046836 TaxID=3156921 RepID=UPI0033F7293E
MSGATSTSRRIDGFEDTVKDFWASRPRRPHQGRKLAGVAAGIGNRYGIDPVVVRVMLVALTIFGGVGIAVYLLGWLFFPAEGDEVSAFENLIGKGRSSVSKGFAAVLCLALIPITGWTFAGDWFDGGGFIGLALIITAIYLLHRGRGHLNRPPTTFSAYTAASSASNGLYAHATSASTAAGWDPLGAAPLNWDLPDAQAEPEPPAPEPPRRRRKSKIGFAAVGVAIAVAGVGTALISSGDPWFTPSHVIGMVLGVLGAGMVAGAFLGGGRGLIWLAVPLAAAGLFLTAVPGVGIDNFRGGVGMLEAQPRTAAEVQPRYERTAGEIRLDLRELATSDTPVVTTLRNGAGNIVVTVPETADVTYTCLTRAGNVDCLGREQSGLGMGPVHDVDFGSDGPGGQRITLDIMSTAGNVEVTRG